MDTAEGRFLRGWNERFPGIDAPRIGCFGDGTLSSVKQGYSECQHRISSLKSKLKQEEYVLHFLKDLHHSCLNFEKKGSRVFSLSDDRTDEEKLELDSPVPIFDLDPHDQHKEGLYKSPDSGGDHRGHDSPLWPVADESGPGNRVSRHGSVNAGQTNRESSPGRERSGSRGRGDLSSEGHAVGDGGKQGGVGAYGGVNIDNRLSSFEHLTKVFKEPLSKTLSEPTNGVIGERNTVERLSQRNRPPVPLPRPSVKGPQFKGPFGSPGSERKFQVGSEASQSPETPVDNLSYPIFPDMAEEKSPSSLNRVRRAHEYCEIDIASLGSRDSIESSGSADDTRGAKDGGDSSEDVSESRRRQRQATYRQRDYVNVTIKPFTSSPNTSPAVAPKAVGPPLLKRREKETPVNNIDSGSSASIGSREEDDEAVIYDNRISGNQQEIIDESSSDDDEPIYFNLMMLKKESMQNASLDSSAIYASVDLDQKEKERHKRRLSKGNLSSPLLRDGSIGPPVPEKPPPSIKGKKRLKGE